MHINTKYPINLDSVNVFDIFVSGVEPLTTRRRHINIRIIVIGAKSNFIDFFDMEGYLRITFSMNTLRLRRYNPKDKVTKISVRCGRLEKTTLLTFFVGGLNFLNEESNDTVFN